MHWHLLLHTKFCCANCLAFEWGQIVKQEFAIVKVLPVDDASYLKEVCKYVVSGSELAKWKAHHILDLVTCLQGTRTFTTFGTFKTTKQFVEGQIELERPPKEICECGCSNRFVASNADEAEKKFNSQFA